MGNGYSYVGAVVGATYPEMGKVLRKIMPKTFILVPGYGAQGGKGADLVHFFNEDGLGAIVNSSRGIIAAYKQGAADAIGAAQIVERTVDTRLRIDFSYTVMNDIMRIVKEEQPAIEAQTFDNLCTMVLAIRNSRAAALEGRLRKVEGATVELLP